MQDICPIMSQHMHASYLFGNIKLKWMVVNKVDSSFMGHYLPNLAKNRAPPMHILDMPQKHTICHMFHHMQNFQSSKCMCIGHKSARL